jgi:hypothetical protein
MASNRSSNTINRTVRSNFNPGSYDKGLRIPAGIYRGIVVNAEDPDGLGRVKVHVAALYGSVEPGLDAGTNNDSEASYLGAHWCQCALPTTSGTTQVANGGQAAYGINGPRPGIDNQVLVAFGSDASSGTVIGVLPDINRTKNTAAGPRVGVSADGTVSPAVTEVGRNAERSSENPPEHPIAERIREQGLDKDRVRGINRSSVGEGQGATRPLGITTPAGHHLVMEDGIGDGETVDAVGVRLRSAGGAQILMDDSNGLIYIINRNGTSWVEMNRNGDIDIYCAKSLNIGTPGDINMTAGGSINMQAGRALNLQANGATGVKIAAPSGSVDIFAHSNLQLQADANGNIRVGGNLRTTAPRIDLNGPPALAAQTPVINELAGNTGATQSIATRVPEAEPWNGHLDVSTLGRGATEGGSDTKESSSYYYGAPTSPARTDGQTADFDTTGSFAPVELPGNGLLSWEPGEDTRVDPDLINIVLEIAQRFGRPLILTSGYRDPARNAKAGGAKSSQHMLGKAVDISSSGLNNQDRLNLIEIASSLGIIGIGVYNSGSMHFDNRSSGTRFGWGSSYSYPSVPSYAKNAIDKHMAGGFPPPAPLSNPAPTVTPAATGPSTSGNTPHDQRLGNLAGEYESNGDARAIGFDSTGGYSYGEYQIASNTGTMNNYMNYIQTNNPAL